MPKVEFDVLPDDARLWVFPVTSPLAADDEARLLAGVDAFVDQWKAHGVPLRAGRAWREGRFLLVAVDPHSEPPSGCSIDALLRELKGFEAEVGVTLTDHASVFYRDGGGRIQAVTRAAFRALARDGAVTPDTAVFDTTLTRVDQLRAGALEAPARETWHGRAFFRETARH